jgi:hypothetical protein
MERDEIDFLLRADESSLLRHLGEPTKWRLFEADGAVEALPIPTITSWSTSDIVSAEQGQRAKGHRGAAVDLRELAAGQEDEEKRTKLERAAELNDALAETLEQLVAARDEQHLALGRLLAEREGRQQPSHQRRPLREMTEQVTANELQSNSLEDQLKALLAEERAATDKARADWTALEYAKGIVAEERGRALMIGAGHSHPAMCKMACV